MAEGEGEGELDQLSQARRWLAWSHIRESLIACESNEEAVGLLTAALAGALCHEGLRDCHPEMLEEVLTILRNTVEQDKAENPLY
jgi:hypothetical protein